MCILLFDYYCFQKFILKTQGIHESSDKHITEDADLFLYRVPPAFST